MRSVFLKLCSIFHPHAKSYSAQKIYLCMEFGMVLAPKTRCTDCVHAVVSMTAAILLDAFWIIIINRWNCHIFRSLYAVCWKGSNRLHSSRWNTFTTTALIFPPSKAPVKSCSYWHGVFTISVFFLKVLGEALFPNHSCLYFLILQNMFHCCQGGCRLTLLLIVIAIFLI